jgi:ribosomal protein S18 acetylase RimI-like enzyme
MARERSSVNTDDDAQSALRISRARKDERSAIARLLASAEVSDPLFEAATRRSERQLAKFFVAYLRANPRHGFHVDVARGPDGTVLGAALWRWQEVGRDSAVLEQIPYLARALAALGAANLVRAFRLQREFERFRPLEPHWHLPYVAVAEHAQRSSIGTSLLSHHLDRIDASVQFAYLEARTPEQVRFFQRLGYVPGGRISGRDGRHYTGMFRTPQRRGR